MSTKVRYKKCLSILPNGIDRVKVHGNKCSNNKSIQTDDEIIVSEIATGSEREDIEKCNL